MARRRTIGDNPLDSISVPLHPDEATETEAPPARAALPARRTAPEARAEGGAPELGATPGMMRYLRRNRIRVLGGDAAPCETRLSPPYPGQARGFYLAKGEFIILKHDVLRLEVRSEQTTRRPDRLLAWAALGAFVAGPVGALAGGLYGGRARALAFFEMRPTDGRTLKAAAHPATVAEMQAELGETLSRG